MTYSPVKLVFLAIILAALPAGPAAVAAAPGEAVQPPADDKSYLPPWMQKPEGSEAKPISAGGATAEAFDPANPDAKLKTPGSKPRKHRSDAFFGFGIFGR